MDFSGLVRVLQRNRANIKRGGIDFKALAHATVGRLLADKSKICRAGWQAGVDVTALI